MVVAGVGDVARTARLALRAKSDKVPRRLLLDCTHRARQGMQHKLLAYCCLAFWCVCLRVRRTRERGFGQHSLWGDFFFFLEMRSGREGSRDITRGDETKKIIQLKLITNRQQGRQSTGQPRLKIIRGLQDLSARWLAGFAGFFARETRLAIQCHVYQSRAQRNSLTALANRRARPLVDYCVTNWLHTYILAYLLTTVQ